MRLSADQRRLFDELLEAVMQELPAHLHELMEEVPLIVEDEPSRQLLRELGMSPRDSELCGLHSGVALPDRSVTTPPNVPDHMMLFRGPILRLAGYDTGGGVVGRRRRAARARAEDPRLAELREQIHITLLHEIGHHFGLDEDDLDRLGYG